MIYILTNISHSSSTSLSDGGGVATRFGTTAGGGPSPPVYYAPHAHGERELSAPSISASCRWRCLAAVRSACREVGNLPVAAGTHRRRISCRRRSRRRCAFDRSVP